MKPYFIRMIQLSGLYSHGQRDRRALLRVHLAAAVRVKEKEKGAMVRNPRSYWAAVMIILILSIYPLYMGAVVLKDYFAYGMVDASNYPNYIIPYTPICIALLISAALSPIIFKLFQRTGYFVTIILSFALFFTAELLFEDITVFSPSGEGSIGSWQMYL